MRTDFVHPRFDASSILLSPVRPAWLQAPTSSLVWALSAGAIAADAKPGRFGGLAISILQCTPPPFSLFLPLGFGPVGSLFYVFCFRFPASSILSPLCGGFQSLYPVQWISSPFFLLVNVTPETATSPRAGFHVHL